MRVQLLFLLVIAGAAGCTDAPAAVATTPEQVAYIAKAENVQAGISDSQLEVYSLKREFEEGRIARDEFSRAAYVHVKKWQAEEQYWADGTAPQGMERVRAPMMDGIHAAWLGMGKLVECYYNSRPSACDQANARYAEVRERFAAADAEIAKFPRSTT